MKPNILNNLKKKSHLKFTFTPKVQSSLLVYIDIYPKPFNFRKTKMWFRLHICVGATYLVSRYGKKRGGGKPE